MKIISSFFFRFIEYGLVISKYPLQSVYSSIVLPHSFSGLSSCLERCPIANHTFSLFHLISDFIRYYYCYNLSLLVFIFITFVRSYEIPCGIHIIFVYISSFSGFWLFLFVPWSRSVCVRALFLRFLSCAAPYIAWLWPMCECENR